MESPKSLMNDVPARLGLKAPGLGSAWGGLGSPDFKPEPFLNVPLFKSSRELEVCINNNRSNVRLEKMAEDTVHKGCELRARRVGQRRYVPTNVSRMVTCFLKHWELMYFGMVTEYYMLSSQCQAAAWAAGLGFPRLKPRPKPWAGRDLGLGSARLI
ncbi:hypothetical protein BDR04DRAFT_1122804 [Suillus decipiens]|nr:hypothetical protein BDR04DRAFT_1122804 [Suillus decipiens]